MIEGRSFQIGEEHMLSSEELAWLNAKLIERHCLPIFPMGGMPTRGEFDKLLPVVCKENKALSTTSDLTAISESMYVPHCEI